MNTAYAVWERPALRAQILVPRRDGRVGLTLAAPTLGNGREALRLEQYLGATPSVTRIEVNVSSRRIRLCFDPDRTTVSAIMANCERAGCAATPCPRDADAEHARAAADAALKRLLVGGLCAMQAMMFALVSYLDLDETVDATTLQLFRWLEMLAATPAVFYAGAPFFTHALHDLRRRRAGIDVPIALAVGVIWLASTINTVRGQGHIWFDSAAMLIFALLLGRYLELRTRQRQGDVERARDSGVPLTACRIDGKRRDHVAVSELRAGDRIMVPEGAMVPVDGRLAGTHACLDTSLHSGESRPCIVHHDDLVAAGSIAIDASVELTVTRVGAATSLARMEALTRRAERQRATTEPTPSRLIGGFMLATATLALGAWGWWMWRDPTRAFDAGVAVLVVACPCAFALAAPATLTRAMTLLARAGIGVARPRALLALARIDHVIVDKTGTLTRPGIGAAELFPRPAFDSDAIMTATVALARASRHPLARALADAHADMHSSTVDDVHVEPGHGIRGRVAGKMLRLGRPANPADDTGEALWLHDDAGVLARFAVHETLRPGTAHALRALADAGIGIELVSGDAHDRVRAIAEQLGIRHWQARRTPADKHATTSARQAEGRVVLMCGDGSNDTAALAAADVSACPHDATDNARRHADLLLDHSLADLLTARNMAQQAACTLRGNRRWGLIWNLIALPFAAAGMISPWLAALSMSASSLIVVLNALLLPPPKARTPARPQRERIA